MRVKKVDKEPQEESTVVEKTDKQEKSATSDKQEVPQLKICPVNPERFYKPTKGTEKATCYDIYLPTDVVVHRGMHVPTRIPLGIKMEIPKGYDVRLYLRSSAGRDMHVIMANAVGIIDEDFRGELTAYVYNVGDYPLHFQEKTRLFQFELHKKDDYAVEFVSSISEDTERGHESGSTGR